MVSVTDDVSCDTLLNITLDDHLDPSSLPPCMGIVYEDNLYLTDDKGNIAFIDCHLHRITPTAPIRKAHAEYRLVGGGRATLEGMDAGHFGLALGQHPSIAMEQNSTMNRYGAWRILERYCIELLEEGCESRIIGVFTEGGDDGTFAPFWCIREEVEGQDPWEYIFTNDDEQ